MTFEKTQTVREIAIKRPAAVRVFETLGIDYCCGGNRPLQEACERANVALEIVISALEAASEEPEVLAEEQWIDTSLAVLTAYIVHRHHRYVRDDSPRLEALLQKVVNRHGETHLELKAIQQTFIALSQELFTHMMKEERILFPHITQMESAVRNGRPAPAGCFGSVELPISRMLADHDNAAELLGKIRKLSHDYRPPEDACPTYRGLYHALEEFERDLHRHVHLENNILFPGAVELERKELAYVR